MIRQVAYVVLGVTVACAEAPQGVSNTELPNVPRNARGGVTTDRDVDRFPDLDSIREVRLDAAALDGAVELDDAALVAAVTKTNGRVIIGLKPPNSPRTKESGVIPAMARAEVLASRQLLTERGISVVRTFRYSSEVVAEIPASLAPVLRGLPFVNFVDPDYVGFPGQSQD